MKSFFLTAAAAMMAFAAVAETATFNFTTENPYGWDDLAKDASGYIDDSAKPFKMTETPVGLSLDGKFRRALQNAFGGITCLLMYQDATADVTVDEGYKITSVSFYSAAGKIEQLASASEGTGLTPQVLTDVKYTHTNGTTEIQEAVRTAVCGAPAQAVDFKVAAKGTQVITKIEVVYAADGDVAKTDYYDFTDLGTGSVAAFPSIKVDTWWTTNPADEGSYTAGTEFRPLTIAVGATTITFAYNGQGGHGNVRGTTTTQQNNLQLGGGSCFTVSIDSEKYRLTKVEVQGNRKRTATGMSMVCDMTTNADGTLIPDADTQVLTWTPADAKNAACYLDANGGAYIERITAHYEGIETGVETVAVGADAPVQYFDLRGVRCMEPAAGLYIRRQGAKVEKVILR